VDLSSSYLGLRLASPVVPGASPLTGDLDSIRRLEDAGAPAVVLPSLFEEQVAAEALGHEGALTDPDRYLRQVRAAKDAVRIPVIASLNGTTDEGWMSFARLVEQAGADALELNLFHISTNLWASGATAETQILESVAAARRSISIPAAVKIFPYFSSIASLARQLEEVGASGLVLFNRLYQPDIDLEGGEPTADPRLSSPPSSSRACTGSRSSRAASTSRSRRPAASTPPRTSCAASSRAPTSRRWSRPSFSTGPGTSER